jgi:hypothetical protein
VERVLHLQDKDRSILTEELPSNAFKTGDNCSQILAGTYVLVH